MGARMMDARAIQCIVDRAAGLDPCRYIDASDDD